MVFGVGVEEEAVEKERELLFVSRLLLSPAYDSGDSSPFNVASGGRCCSCEDGVEGGRGEVSELDRCKVE